MPRVLTSHSGDSAVFIHPGTIFGVIRYKRARLDWLADFVMFASHSYCVLLFFPWSQGAFYILGEDIVAHLNRSRDMLAVMSVEDAMMGLWLLGVDKV